MTSGGPSTGTGGPSTSAGAASAAPRTWTQFRQDMWNAHYGKIITAGSVTTLAAVAAVLIGARACAPTTSPAVASACDEITKDGRDGLAGPVVRAGFLSKTCADNGLTASQMADPNFDTYTTVNLALGAPGCADTVRTSLSLEKPGEAYRWMADLSIDPSDLEACYLSPSPGGSNPITIEGIHGQSLDEVMSAVKDKVGGTECLPCPEWAQYFKQVVDELKLMEVGSHVGANLNGMTGRMVGAGYEGSFDYRGTKVVLTIKSYPKKGFRTTVSVDGKPLIELSDDKNPRVDQARDIADTLYTEVK